MPGQEKKREAPAETGPASGFWTPCLLRRVKTSTVSGTSFVPLDFLHLFPRVFLHEMEILTLSEAVPSWESSFSVTYGHDF